MPPANKLLILLYLASCAGISAFALSSFARIIQAYLAIRYDYQTEMFMVVGQVGFQWLFMRKSSWAERRTYAILALSVSMIGSVLLVPLILFDQTFAVPPIVATAWFFAVVGVIFIIHHALIVRAKLPARLTLTWALYRILLLAYVLIPRSQ